MVSFSLKPAFALMWLDGRWAYHSSGAADLFNNVLLRFPSVP